MSNWISVKDRLPEEASRVLIVSEGGYFMVCGFRGKRFFEGYSWSLRDVYYNVTHWQPLPEPPKDGE